eukprot:TRINITY_DN16821_c0_g1_i1.p1 TRINITY_DN16821_c0_g1~~TRINITY_DN16821_c0_g1_i1.p1  ORF type:complete len:272 (+),score=16.23 TRINITY_DN16821_c0_g1_i1:43-858(+)
MLLLDSAWITALVFTAGIGIVPVFIILLIPLIKYDKKGVPSIRVPLLRTLLGFAAGGLLGDAILHLLPHAVSETTSDLKVGLLVLLGIFTFFVLEKVIRASHSDSGGGHSHSHSHAHDHSHDTAAGLLNLVADFSHNCTDGMAIAASFLVSPAMGLSTSIAIMLHEIPHEVGDYAILVQSGMSKTKAICMQFVTAIGAMAGCLIGLVAGGVLTWFTEAILPITAGGFVYISLVEILPSLMSGISLNFGQSCMEVGAFAAGVVSMVIIALFE